MRSGSAHLDLELAVAVDAEAGKREAGKRGGLASPDKSRGPHLSCRKHVIFGGRIFQTQGSFCPQSSQDHPLDSGLQNCTSFLAASNRAGVDSGVHIVWGWS